MGKLPPLSSNTARKFPSDPWKMWQYRMTLWLVAPYMCTCIYNIVRYMNSNRYIYISGVYTTIISNYSLYIYICIHI
jgi:hypothetical protein